MPDVDPWRDVVDAVLAAAGLPSAGPVRRLGGGSANHVYCVDDRWVVRLGTGPDGQCFPKSVAVLRAIEARVLAPRVVYADTGRCEFPVNVMVCQYIPGRSLCDAWPELSESQRWSIYEQAARQLDALHGIPPEQVPFFAGAPPWPVELRRQLDGGFRDAAHIRSAVDLGRLRAYVEEHWPAVTSAPAAVLVHNDVHWNNIVVRGDRFAGLLDWDDLVLAPPEAEAWVMMHFLAGTQYPHDPLPSPAALRWAMGWVHRLWPGRLDTADALHRYRINIIRDILSLLTETPSWLTPEDARAEAEGMYRAAFVEPGVGWSWEDDGRVTG